MRRNSKLAKVLEAQGRLLAESLHAAENLHQRAGIYSAYHAQYKLVVDGHMSHEDWLHMERGFAVRLDQLEPLTLAPRGAA